VDTVHCLDFIPVGDTEMPNIQPTEQEARTETYTVVYHTTDEQEIKEDVSSLEELLLVLKKYHTDPHSPGAERAPALYDILGMGSVLRTEARAPYTIRWQLKEDGPDPQDPKWDIDCPPEMVTLLERIGHMMNSGYEIANINEKGGRSLVTDSWRGTGKGYHRYK
jgi:hypothetical protein